MTVAELIENLKKLPQNAVVVSESGESWRTGFAQYNAIERVRKTEVAMSDTIVGRYYDPRNSDAERIAVVVLI